MGDAVRRYWSEWTFGTFIGLCIIALFTANMDHNQNQRLDRIEQRLTPVPTPSAALIPRVAPPVASRSRTAPPSELWAARPDVRALRECESGDRLHAVSPTGKYHGLYQTTASWGRGTRAEQNRGAWILWRRHGAAPWPWCGRFLR